jgi:hypothetical protein
MAQANYKVTITDRTYHHITYTAWVSATSKNQAIIQGAALAGREKLIREHQRQPRNDLAPEIFFDPEVKLEPVSVDEYWDKRDTVEVSA